MNQLHQPFPPEWVETFRKDGNTLDFVPWHRYVYRLETDDAVEEWESEVVDTRVVGNQLFMVVNVTVNGVTHSGTGVSEDAQKTSWGGAHAEAYSQAFRRACAHHGLGLYFYSDEEADGQTGVDHDSMDSGDSGRMVDTGGGPTGAPDSEGVVRPTEAQKERLSKLFDTGVFREEHLDAWRTRMRENWTRSSVGSIIREMKEQYEEETGVPYKEDNS